MANTLTGLIPVIYKSLDTVARERVGLSSKVTMDANANSAALNQTVRSFVAPVSAAVDNAPGSYAPNTGGQAMGYNDITITKSKSVPLQWTGEEILSVGSQYESMLADQFSQAFRTLTNLIEVDLAAEMVANASRAVGAAATTPFTTVNDLSDSAGVLKVLDDNGAPTSGLCYVANNATMANFRGKQTVLFKANEAGTDEMLRKGTIGDLQGMKIGQSAALSASHTAGTGGATYRVNGVHAVGATTIAVDTGSGTIVAGDVITFGDGFKYVVKTALSGGNLVINAPGLMKALAGAETVTLSAAYVSNLAFHPNSTILMARQPIMPPGGDAAVDVMPITDPVSGITYQVAMYRGYRQIHLEIGCAWGVKTVKPEFIALNLG